MCGIAGAINFKLPYHDIDAAMGHRGPDAQAGFAHGNVDLYHLRLSILDVAHGGQPMHLDDRYSIVFNGQIYNHRQLKGQFGLDAKTNSDTETLLLLYRKMGAKMLEYLDGMFAMAIYDAANQTVFIARDRAGKKPLYVYNDGEKIVFASELNCLAAMVSPEIDRDNFLHYLRLGTFYRKLTPYRNVAEVAGGTSLQIDCRSLRVTETKWWNITDQYLESNKDTEQESFEKVDALLSDAVKSRLESSDLEVGCFLSGGIDSGLITAMAAPLTPALKTFTVSFPGNYNEAPLAALVAKKYNTIHTEIDISFDNLKGDVEQILSNYGEPFFDSSAIPSFYVSREAKKAVTVILNGDGADELFGGYRRYVPFAKYDFFKKNGFVRRAAQLITAALPQPHDKKAKYNYLYRLASLASKSEVDIYLAAGVDIIEGYEQNILTGDGDYLREIKTDFEHISRLPISGLRKIMTMDFDGNLFSDLLVKMDIAAMANSLEGRSPFLSKDLLEYAPTMNDSLKIKGTTTKYLLRKLAEKYLPQEIVGQPKRGFEIPLKSWVNNELNDVMRSYIGPSSAFCRSFFRDGFVDNLLANKIKMPAEKRAKILWTLFSMEVWHKKNYSESNINSPKNDVASAVLT